MSRYTVDACRRRAEAAEAICAGDGQERIAREHDEAAASGDEETSRIARGFAIIALRRAVEESWRADAYRRLQDGEEIES